MKNNKRTLIIFSITAAILMIPLVAMQFTKEVAWSGSDFLIMGILLSVTAFFVDFILRKVAVNGKRFFYIALALIVFFLIWAELAVGIFGTPFAGSQILKKINSIIKIKTMKKHHLILLTTALFITLFYGENVGLNLGILGITYSLLLLYKTPERSRTRVFLILFVAISTSETWKVIPITKENQAKSR